MYAEPISSRYWAAGVHRQIISMNTDQKEIFGKNLKKMRESIGFTQDQLAKEMNLRTGNQKPLVRAQTVSSWERGHIPNVAKLKVLTSILGVSVDYLTGINKSDNSMPLNSFNLYQSCTRIEKKDLLQFSFEPLYFVPYIRNTMDRDDMNGMWGILSSESKYFVSVDRKIPTESMNGIFFTLRPFPIKKVISLEEAKKREKIYVMPEGIERKLMVCLRGWYFYDEEHKIFVKEDYSFCFSEEQYGARYFGYADVPDVI